MTSRWLPLRSLICWSSAVQGVGQIRAAIGQVHVARRRVLGQVGVDPGRLIPLVDACLAVERVDRAVAEVRVHVAVRGSIGVHPGAEVRGCSSAELMAAVVERPERVIGAVEGEIEAGAGQVDVVGLDFEVAVADVDLVAHVVVQLAAVVGRVVARAAARPIRDVEVRVAGRPGVLGGVELIWLLAGDATLSLKSTP